MSEHEEDVAATEPPETLSESLLRAGKELLDASKQTLQDLDAMLTDVATDVAGDPEASVEPEPI